jgi:hypothetical protein
LKEEQRLIARQLGICLRAQTHGDFQLVTLHLLP